MHIFTTLAKLASFVGLLPTSSPKYNPRPGASLHPNTLPAYGLPPHQLHSFWHHSVFSLASHTLAQIAFEELGTPGTFDLFAD